jgi:hypothetical protein
MTPTQRVSKRKSVKLQKLRLQASEARTNADRAIALARAAKVEFKKTRKAHKLARRTAKAARKKLKALLRKLEKFSSRKPKRPVKPAVAPSPPVRKTTETPAT